MTDPDATRLVDVALDAARTAGVLLVEQAARLAEGADLGVGSKATPTDLVSEADRAAERLIAQHLQAARPDDGLLGEEGEASHRGTSGLRWVIDPLDGTINFLHGLATWCVSIAVEDERGILAGVVHQPTTGDTFHAARGQGAHLDGHPLAVSRVTGLGDILLATGFAYDAAIRVDQGRDVADLLPRVRDLRRAGSAALDLAWCAAGRVDGYLEFGLAPWDWAAGRLLVTEAGGTVSTPTRFLGGRERPGVVAGGPVAHDALAAWLSEEL
ncbi:MAG: inositol monophosphatase [Intrasporangiaceae bacterium]|nr:inositol monophosphatase [Intrasporangiaceae bacterium]